MNSIRVFLCGDVMTGRGIDRILPYPCQPRLYERYVTSADDYVRLAEAANGPIPHPVDFSYIWGAALEEWRRVQPQLRLVNLETAVTRRESYLHKGINYRMSPENIGCLGAAGIDCCALANNHVLDWAADGLIDTLEGLKRHQITTCGAGRNIAEAGAPAIHAVTDGGRIIIYSFALATSGTPASWAATSDEAGVNFLPDLSDATADNISMDIERTRKLGDIVIVSIHWGPNWGYEIPDEQRRFARRLIEQADVSAIHGHSAHHPKAIEVHCNRLILYGCGDFINDYEGITGYEEYRDDLSIMYFATFDNGSADLRDLELVVQQIKRFRLHAALREDTEWVKPLLEAGQPPDAIRLRFVSDNRLQLEARI